MHSSIRSTVARLVYSAVLAGCASQHANPPPSTPASQPSAAIQSAADLRGTWVEYWAVSGGADTDRFAFDEHGRFDWHASAKARAETPSAIEKAGAFRIEQNGQASVLVLEVQRERFAGCAAPCTPGAQHGEAREVEHSAPIIERHELGECPVNPEAEQIDASYTCRAIGGKAYWRKTPETDASSARRPGITPPS